MLDAAAAPTNVGELIQLITTFQPIARYKKTPPARSRSNKQLPRKIIQGQQENTRRGMQLTYHMLTLHSSHFRSFSTKNPACHVRPEPSPEMSPSPVRSDFPLSPSPSPPPPPNMGDLHRPPCSTDRRFDDDIASQSNPSSCVEPQD